MSPRSVSVWRQAWVHSCLQAVQKARRMALPNAEIMIHQPSGGAQGQATDIEIAAEAYSKDQEED